MNVTQFQDVLGLKLPGTMESILGKPISEIQVPPASKLLAWGSVAVLAVLLFEQLKFAWFRRGKGSMLPGERGWYLPCQLSTEACRSFW